MTSRQVLLLALGFALAQPAEAYAQSRRKDDSRRTAPREQPTADRGDRRRETGHESDRRMPMPELPPPRPRDDDDRGVIHGRDDRYDRADRERIIVLPSLGYGYGSYYESRSSYYDDGYYRGYYGNDDGGYVAEREHVWARYAGMTCEQLNDELEWAHDEWHYRYDRLSNGSWYELEHARLEYRIAQERAYSGCGPAPEELDCAERGRYPRVGTELEAAITVLDILLGSGSDESY